MGYYDDKLPPTWYTRLERLIHPAPVLSRFCAIVI